MKGFYWGTGVVRCSYCNKPGHNITSCSLVTTAANTALKKIEHDPDYVCSPYEHRALVEIKKREERKLTKRRPRRKPRCSFCKQEGHNRPKCDELKDFRLKVYQANKNWKRTFVSRATEIGLGVGALVQLDKKTTHVMDYNVDPHRIAMITEFDYHNLNVFCGLDIYSEFQSNATVKVLSGDREDNLSIKYFASLIGEDLLHKGWWYSYSQPSVVSPMALTPDTDWLDSEWDEILNWFFNNVDKSDLISSGLMKYIDKWSDEN